MEGTDWRELANIIANCERANVKLEMIKEIYLDDNSLYYGTMERNIMRILGINPDDLIKENMAKKKKEIEENA